MEITNTEFSFACSGEIDVVPCAEINNFTIMASLKAPHCEITHRAAIDLVTVIDRSGSMDGDKLKLVLQTLSFIIRQLLSKDKLAVVTYDDKVATPLVLTAMTNEGKNTANHKVKSIVAGNCTDLCSGLVTGIQVFNERTARNEVSSLLLFTDGLANAGKQKTSEIIEEMAKYEPLPCTIYTFGFGSDHDPTLLKAISDKGNGVYSFITDKDTIATAFADCLGGLLSVVAQNIIITIQPLNGIIISNLNTTYKYEEQNGVITLTIGDIQSEEEKDILFNLKVPSVQEAGELPIIDLKVSYFDVIGSHQVDKSVIFSLNRNDNISPTINLAVDRQKNRLIVTDAIAEAKKLGDSGDITSGRQIVNDAMQKLKASATAQDEYIQSLIKDLEDCLASLKDNNSYISRGTYQMSTYYSSHSYQRSNYSVQSYSNTTRRAMQQQAEQQAKDDF